MQIDILVLNYSQELYFFENGTNLAQYVIEII